MQSIQKLWDKKNNNKSFITVKTWFEFEFLTSHCEEACSALHPRWMGRILSGLVAKYRALAKVSSLIDLLGLGNHSMFKLKPLPVAPAEPKRCLNSPCRPELADWYQELRISCPSRLAVSQRAAVILPSDKETYSSLQEALGAHSQYWQILQQRHFSVWLNCYEVNLLKGKVHTKTRIQGFLFFFSCFVEAAGFTRSRDDATQMLNQSASYECECTDVVLVGRLMFFS